MKARVSGGLAGENLRGQIVDDVAVISGERVDEFVGVFSAAQRQCRQIQARRPSFGPLDEALHVRRFENQPLVGDQQRVRIVDREPEIRGGDLQQLPPPPEPGQRQRRLDPRGEHQLQARRGMVKEVGHGLVDLSVVDRVVVLEHEHAALRQRVQLVDQDRQHLVDDVHTRGAEDRC